MQIQPRDRKTSILITRLLFPRLVFAGGVLLLAVVWQLRAPKPARMERLAVEATEQFPFLVFVYGTLKEGFYNYASVMQPLHEGGHFVKLHGSARTKGFLFVDSYYVPYLATDTGGIAEDSTVMGEVYGVDQIMLDALDELEGIAQGRYTRSEVDVTLLGDNIQTARCFLYHLKTLPSVVGEQNIQSMPSYDLAGHEAKYVPKKDRDMSRYREWGGFE